MTAVFVLPAVPKPMVSSRTLANTNAKRVDSVRCMVRKSLYSWSVLIEKQTAAEAAAGYESKD